MEVTLREHGAVLEARVRVRKPHVPIACVLDAVAVEVVRGREDVAARQREAVGESGT